MATNFQGNFGDVDLQLRDFESSRAQTAIKAKRGSKNIEKT
jgi:hypothetical protein